MLQIQEMTGQGWKARGVDKETTDDQNRLVVRLGRIAQCAKITGLVDEAETHFRSPEKAMATGWWP